jgi:hypothetical protein
MATGARATGLAASTVRRGTNAWTRPSTAVAVRRRLRPPGAGRKPLTAPDQPRLQALDALVAPTTRGDPLSPRRWPCTSPRRWAQAWGRPGPQVRHRTVGPWRKARNDRFQGPRPPQAGTSPPDRTAPCEAIKARVKDCHQRGQPVVAVDPTQPARVGDYAHGGREAHPPGAPERVRVQDGVDTRRGKALPDGVDEMTQHWGGVSVGVEHEPAAWWMSIGRSLS